MNEENSTRVRKQRHTPITVVIGNPPYNAGQDEENDANANRTYPVLDRRVRETYAVDSVARNRNSLDDPYIKAFRWASDRIKDQGVVAFVTNGKYIHGKATDGVRLHLESDFDDIYVLDMGGDVRSNPKLSGTTHNVFGIQTGVAISILVRRTSGKHSALIRHARFAESAKASLKLNALVEWKSYASVEWSAVPLNGVHRWIGSETQAEFAALLPLATAQNDLGIFHKNSNGLKSNRDKWVFNQNRDELVRNIVGSIAFFNDHIERRSKDRTLSIDEFVVNDDSRLSWSDNLKAYLQRGMRATFSKDRLRRALYRPYTSEWLYFDRHFNERIYGLESIFPKDKSNRVIIVTSHLQVPFSAQVSNQIPCVDVGERPSMCFPFWTFEENGRVRGENISSTALHRFHRHYVDVAITKWDIFHATYAVLHHPEYRTRYAANLKRELPRIPFPPDFHAFAAAGKRLMDLHIDYEQQAEYPLQQIESEDRNVEVSFRVARMKLSKDKTELRYNDFLLLRGIPPAVFDYRLGNRSALEWVIDQYRVTTDARSGITNDPNREDDPKYILRLIGQVITVSLETQAIIAALPSLHLDGA